MTAHGRHVIFTMDRLLSVYVDEFKLAGPTLNMTLRDMKIGTSIAQILACNMVGISNHQLSCVWSYFLLLVRCPRRFQHEWHRLVHLSPTNLLPQHDLHLKYVLLTRARVTSRMLISRAGWIPRAPRNRASTQRQHALIWKSCTRPEWLDQTS